MNEIDLKIVKRGCEVLTIRVSTMNAEGIVLSEDVNLNGNSTTCALWGATEVLKAVNKLLEQKNG